MEKKEDLEKPQEKNVDLTTTLNSLYGLRAGMTLVRDIFAHNGESWNLAWWLVKWLCELQSIIDEQSIRVEIENTHVK